MGIQGLYRFLETYCQPGHYGSVRSRLEQRPDAAASPVGVTRSGATECPVTTTLPDPDPNIPQGPGPPPADEPAARPVRPPPGFELLLLHPASVDAADSIDDPGPGTSASPGLPASYASKVLAPAGAAPRGPSADPRSSSPPLSWRRQPGDDTAKAVPRAFGVPWRRPLHRASWSSVASSSSSSVPADLTAASPPPGCFVAALKTPPSGGNAAPADPAAPCAHPPWKTTVSMNSLHGRRVAVDASLFLYQCVFAGTAPTGGPASSSSPPPPLAAGHPSRLHHAASSERHFLQALLARLAEMTAAGWHLLFVFDGKPPAAKHSVLMARRQHRQVAQAKLSSPTATSMSSKERATWLRRTVMVTRDHVNDTKDVLQCLDIPWVEAAGEADVVCAWMCRQGWVDAVLTDDSDLLALQCPCVIRTQTLPGHRVDVFHMDGILCDLRMSPAQFVFACVLLGSDYAPRYLHLRLPELRNWVRRHVSGEGGADAAWELLAAAHGVDPSAWRAAWRLFAEARLQTPAVSRWWCPAVGAGTGPPPVTVVTVSTKGAATADAAADAAAAAADAAAAAAVGSAASGSVASPRSPESESAGPGPSVSHVLFRHRRLRAAPLYHHVAAAAAPSAKWERVRTDRVRSLVIMLFARGWSEDRLLEWKTLMTGKLAEAVAARTSDSGAARC